MATIQQVVKLTYEDYLTTPADTRYELLDGDLILVPAPNLKHQKVQRRLGQRLSQFIEEHDLGEFFYAPCDVFLSNRNVVQPDLLFVSQEREDLLSDGEKVGGAPDLVVEILSPSTADKDRGIKRELYSTYGVTEYWLVDPIAETVSIHRRRGGVLAATHTFGRGQTLRSPLSAGLELRMDECLLVLTPNGGPLVTREAQPLATSNGWNLVSGRSSTDRSRVSACAHARIWSSAMAPARRSTATAEPSRGHSARSLDPPEGP